MRTMGTASRQETPPPPKSPKLPKLLGTFSMLLIGMHLVHNNKTNSDFVVTMTDIEP